MSNLSSTRALAEVTRQYGGNYVASAVGEAHVVELMKKTDAVIGGEGNGGVIYPDLHYGRDALVGIALFLSHLCMQIAYCFCIAKPIPKLADEKRQSDIDSCNTMLTPYLNR